MQIKNTPTSYPPELGGNRLVNTLKWFYQPYAHMNKALTQCGSSFFTHVPALGRVLVTGDPKPIKATVNNDALVGGRSTRVLRPLLGEDTLIILESKIRIRGQNKGSSTFYNNILLNRIRKIE